jgi:hypothetical protein
MERKTGIFGAVLAVLLAVMTLSASAAEQIGRDFNHMTTGFPLSGGHAAAACETCHVGGVFKGTPRACDGCHAVGKRVVATPKNDRHIVTDAPCESCHFNTATWLGVRYNHGSAVVGQCRTCHNGRQAEGKAASHGVGKKATESCDSCHRTFAWTPASWNHNLSSGVCSTCHTNAATVSSANLKPAGHASPALKGTEACDACHSYIAWYPNRFKHNIAGTCSSCHLNGAKAVGQPTSHNSFTSWPTECNQCHTSTTTWSGALGAKPAKHIPDNGNTCTSCHVGTSVKTGSALHAYLGGIACYTCHGSNTAYSGQGQKTDSWPSFHESSKNPSATDCSASGCHRPAGSKGVLYSDWD